MGRLSEQDNLENLRERLEWSVALLGLIAAIVEDTNWACRCRSVSLLHLIECQDEVARNIQEKEEDGGGQWRTSRCLATNSNANAAIEATT